MQFEIFERYIIDVALMVRVHVPLSRITKRALDEDDLAVVDSLEELFPPLHQDLNEVREIQLNKKQTALIIESLNLCYEEEKRNIEITGDPSNLTSETFDTMGPIDYKRYKELKEKITQHYLDN